MIDKIKPYFSNKDDRGEMVGLVNFGEWKEFNFAQSKANVVRGDHYHKDTVELFYIIEGEVEFVTQKVESNQLTGDKHTQVFKSGDTFQINPNTFHTVTTLTECKWINILSKAFDPKAPDLQVPENF